jgi:hypothetical protein
MNYSTKVFTCKRRHPVKNEPCLMMLVKSRAIDRDEKANIHALGEISILDFGILRA